MGLRISSPASTAGPPAAAQVSDIKIAKAAIGATQKPRDADNIAVLKSGTEGIAYSKSGGAPSISVGLIALVDCGGLPPSEKTHNMPPLGPA